MSSEGENVTRRYMLQTIGAVGAAGLAGCGGNGSSPPESSEPDPDFNPPSEDSESGEDEETNENDNSEAEHIGTKELFESWGTKFPGHERILIDSFSPSQVSETLNTTWMEGQGEFRRYEPLPFGTDDVPEKIIQETPNSSNQSYVIVDQLPGYTSEDDVAESLLDSGYVKDSTVEGFDIYTIGDMEYSSGPKDNIQEARAIGDGFHLLAMSAVGDVDSPSTSDHIRYLERAIEDNKNSEDELPEDIADCLEVANVQDTLTAIEYDGEYMVSIESEQPIAGLASTNFENGDKVGVWKFETEQQAENAIRYLKSEDFEMGNGFSSVQRQDNFIGASGKYQFEERFGPDEYSGSPWI